MLLKVKSAIDWRDFDSEVASILVDCKTDIRHSRAEFFLNFCLPFRVVGTVVDKSVVGFQALLDLGKQFCDVTALRSSVNVHR